MVYVCTINQVVFAKYTNVNGIKNKRPMGNIAHQRKQFKSMNTYHYIIMLKAGDDLEFLPPGKIGGV